jgi:transcriptional regulator with XRE-family HTH domain
MRRENLMARMLRALAGTTQEQAAEALDVHPSLISQIEMDEVAPSPSQLETMARQADLTVAGAEELLAHYDALRRSGRWRGQGREETLEVMKATMRDHLTRGFEELNALLDARDAAREAEAQRADELWARLEKYPEATQMELVEVADEYQSTALADLIFDLYILEMDRDPERAASLRRVARKIRELARASTNEPARQR